MVTGNREPRARFCLRPNRLAEAEGNRSKIVSVIREFYTRKNTKPARNGTPALPVSARQAEL
jgi:hypothetical protein